MRILQFCKKLPFPPKDGESIAILNISKGLAEAGHDVTVLAINTKRHRGDLRDIPVELRQAIRFRAVDLDTDPRWSSAFLNLFSPRSYHLSRFHDDRVWRALREAIEGGEFDVVQIEGLFGLQYLEQIRSVHAGSIVYRAHNIEYQIWNRLLTGEPNPLKRAYLALQTRRLERFERDRVTQVDGWVPISPLDGDTLATLAPHMPRHDSPATVRLEDWDRDRSKPRQPRIGFLGGLDWIPNQEGLRWFIEQAFPRVRQTVPDAELHIAGRNQPAWMNSWSGPGIVLHGEVEDAGDYMADQSIMIVPLLSGSGMRIKVIEAMAAHMAVVSTPIGAEGIPVRNGTDIALAEDPVAFADAVIHLLLDAEAAGHMARQARGTVEAHFDYRPVCKRLADFLESLTSQNG